VSTLLETAVAAHGGLERWRDLHTIKLDASITGGIWYVKGRPDVLKEVEVRADLHAEKVRMHFPQEGKTTWFKPDRISIETEGSEDAVVFEHPLRYFEGHTRETPWEDVHVAYFSGEALWTYLTIPFLYTLPGFEVEELSPWQENGEIWRRLKVIFPENIVSHCQEQISYFGPDGLLRRHDYTVDILGGASGVNYASNYQTVHGIVIPATRRVFAYEGDHVVVPEPLLVAIDFCNIEFP
jgi:hypothetical protein